MAQISASEQPHMKQIDLATLNVQQLSTLKQQLDQVKFFNLLKKTYKMCNPTSALPGLIWPKVTESCVNHYFTISNPVL